MKKKVLNVNFKNLSDELSMKLEEVLLNIKDISFVFEENEKDTNLLIIKNNKEINTLKDVANEGKIVKEFWIKNNLFNDKNYIKFFTIKEIEIETNWNEENEKSKKIDELDKLIAKVPENDEKVLDIMKQLNKIKKTKDNT